MTAHDTPGPDGPDGPDRQEADEAPPMNRAERRGKGRKAAESTGYGKIRGSKFSGSAKRQYQNRKHG
jgi:hypothetical protein